MGARNQVGEHAVIGGEPQDLKFKADTVSGVEIGDYNVLR
jgi:acyl-[acyl carrier protein]--UDP-N-acetylglucosamine O-acyltransferase